MTAPISFYERVEEALADSQLREAMSSGPKRLADNRLKAIAAYPQMAWMRSRARQIRAHTIAHLDQYLSQFADAVASWGGHVHWAKDGAEANQIILQLAQANDVKRVIKSKSMVSEETEINEALEQAGIEVIESDLGEFIIQLAHEKPSHIIGPAMHKKRQQVGALFAKTLGVPFTDDPFELNKIARRYLRHRFLTADLGISGVNFAVAESGSMALVMNEGNGRFTTTAPRIHIAMMGMERIVPTMTDLGVMLQVLARSATGQKLSVYTNILTGPRRPGEADGPEQFHVVILDNGRSQLLGSELAEILYCIRCGACVNICPVYREIGGHAYGHVYTGPIGAVLTPGLEGIAPWKELPHASTLCGACQEVCPVHIQIPSLLLKLRAASARQNLEPNWIKSGLAGYGRAATSPTLYNLGLQASARATRFVGKNGWIDHLPGPLAGWTKHRDFPAFAPKSFRQLWQERKAND